MEKNGKKIRCKNCNKEFYISESRFGTRKYCSRECAVQDNWGFKRKEKKCLECGKTFFIENQLQTGNKYCSKECSYLVALRRSKEQSEKRKKQFKEINCDECGKKTKVNLYNNSKYCSNECRFKALSKNRQGKKNPAYRNGLAIAGKRNYTGKHLRACSKYKKNYLSKHDYLECELCRVNKNGTLKFEVHHIYAASIKPQHKQLHNPKNLILLCVQCHNDMHMNKKKKEFNRIEKERGLKKLFN